MSLKGVNGMCIKKIEAVGRQPLSTIVYENIKKAIINGDIVPGTRLTETKTSEQLGVSTTPVREAFRRLESERFVKNIPYKGAIVQELSMKEIEEVYQCRLALEVAAIGLVAKAIDQNGLESLRNLVEQSKQHSTFLDYEIINTAIHDKILSYTENDTMKGMLKQLHEVVYHNRSMYSLSERRRLENYKEHLRIVEALEMRDVDEAKEAMTKHIENAYTYIEEKNFERQQKSHEKVHYSNKGESPASK